MATFKVGMRVKRVRDTSPGAQFRAAQTPLPIGATGTVTDPNYLPGYVGVIADNDDAERGVWGCQPDTLEPITDSDADWAADKVRKLLDNIPQPTLAEILHEKLRAA